MGKIMKKQLIAAFTVLFILFIAPQGLYAGTIPKDVVHYRLEIPGGDIKAFYQWTPGRKPMISAHRGGPMPGYPENALETFYNATKYGPMIIEMDLARTRDGTIVLMHDKSLDRTTTCKGLVISISYSGILKCKLVDNSGNITAFKVPTLKDTLSWAKGKVVLQLDFKKDVPYAQVVEAVRQAGMENSVVLISYTFEQALAMHAAGPELMLSVTLYNQKMLDRVKTSVLPMDQIVAWVGTRVGNSDFYAKLHREGLFVAFGTLGRPDRSLDGQIERSGSDAGYLNFIFMGVDIIATDRMHVVAPLLRNSHIFYTLPAQKVRQE